VFYAQSHSLPHANVVHHARTVAESSAAEQGECDPGGQGAATLFAPVWQRRLRATAVFLSCLCCCDGWECQLSCGRVFLLTPTEADASSSTIGAWRAFSHPLIPCTTYVACLISIVRLFVCAWLLVLLLESCCVCYAIAWGVASPFVCVACQGCLYSYAGVGVPVCTGRMFADART
jgi:hypothetical protein